MATFSTTKQEVVMVVDRSGSHRAHKLDATLAHYQGTWRFHCFPAHCGHHRNPVAGFWRVMQTAWARDGMLPICLSSTSARAKYSWGIKSVPCMRFTGSGFSLELSGSCS